MNGVGKETEEVFSTVLYLPPGKYEYKFVVDGAWHYDPKQPVVVSIFLLCVCWLCCFVVGWL